MRKAATFVKHDRKKTMRLYSYDRHNINIPQFKKEIRIGKMSGAERYEIPLENIRNLHLSR